MRYILTGVETRNKGAELMLYAILQQIEMRDPNAEVFLRMEAVRQGFNYVHTNVCLREKPYKKMVMKARKWKVISVLARLGINTIPFFSDARLVKEVDYVIDGSGFWFSDQWNLECPEIDMWCTMLTNYRKAGARIIFLPQAFGPIELPNTKKVIASIAENADIIMPREIISYNYMKNAGVPLEKLCIFPDFTSLVEGEVPSGYEHLKDGVCVIPNVRMIDKGGISFDDYLKILEIIIRKAQSLGKVVYLLNHEGEHDENLSILCQEKLGKDIQVVTGLNGLEIKGLISTASLCITSRFHGAASALNSCVPCLATSWSHKYEELFRDYGQEDCVLNLFDIHSVERKIESFLVHENNFAIRKVLKHNVSEHKEQTKEMWKVVFGE